MKKTFLLLWLAVAAVPAAAASDFYPQNGSVGICPDTHLTITFDQEPTLGTRGFISVYDKQTGRLVDRLDMSVPAGPTTRQPRNPDAIYTPVPYVYRDEVITNRNTRPGTPSGAAKEVKSPYQLTIIGGFSDGFHFYPVIVHGRRATIYLHNNMLEYGHEYYVKIDKGVFVGQKAMGGKREWSFSTKREAPDKSQRRLVVAADGSGDFCTLQGAMDHVPNFVKSEADRYTVFVRNGDYEELVYFRNKSHVSIVGESRDGVVVHYPNNEVFNPHPADIKTNELKGTFPSRRAAVAADNCTDMTFRNITFQTDCKGQAEGFLLNGERNVLENVRVVGDGDALQANGSSLFIGCLVEGGGDTVLGRGPCYFSNCTIKSRGAFMWIRNGKENHGNVFVNCRLQALAPNTYIARLPNNGGQNYPWAECVLIGCQLEGVHAEGWTLLSDETPHANMAEYMSTDANGNAIDTSKRNARVRQLSMPADREEIMNYLNPHYVLGF